MPVAANDASWAFEIGVQVFQQDIEACIWDEEAGFIQRCKELHVIWNWC